MKKGSSIFGKTITIEFYVDSDKVLHVIYNMHKYTFSEFWKNIEDAEDVCKTINNEFKNQFPNMFKSSGLNSGNWMETFIKFVNSHLGEYNKILDVIIKSNGAIIINLERL